MYCSSSKSPDSAACLPVIGALPLKMYSPRAPSRLQCQSRSNSAIAASTPSHQRLPRAIIFSKLAGVNTSVSVAFIAAKESPLPANVPPIPPKSIISNSTIFVMASAISCVMPNVPVGIPAASALPMVRKSGFKPRSLVIPPGPTEMVWVSSMIK